MNTAIIPTNRPDDNTRALMPAPGGDKNQRSRLTQFVDWLNSTGGHWSAPNLEAYRDNLLERGLKASSVSAHLSTIRGHYAGILRDSRTRDMLYSLTPPDASPADKKAVVDELIERLRNAVHPDTAPVTIIRSQDTADSAHLRLTIDQAETLLTAPGVDTLTGLRDTALIAMMLCTGIREAEVIALDVKDLRQHLGGALALHVRRGKGAKERLIPYGALDWCLLYVEKWLGLTGIEAGAVFRAFYKGGRRVRPGRLSLRAVQDILNRYPVIIEGRAVAVNPHDLRRTYARRLYEAGVPLLAIQQNLGHADSKTTEGYIGRLDADQRQPPRLFRPPNVQRLNTLKTLADEPSAAKPQIEPPKPSAPVVEQQADQPNGKPDKHAAVWAALNERQRHYLKAVYTIDQENEAHEKTAWVDGRRRRPASEWRWMKYHPTGLSDQTRLQREIGAAFIDEGTGSTFEALEKRGLIECRYQRSLSGSALLSVMLTTKGRAVARAGMDVKTDRRPKGAFSRKMWSALKLAYEAGEDGIEPDGYGYSYGGIGWQHTWVHLRNYKAAQLVTERRSNISPTGYMMKITEEGRQLYEERLELHRALYPDLYSESSANE